MQAPGNFQAETFTKRHRQPTLILVGASVRAAAQSACQAGFSVIGIDSFGDTDTLQACDHHHQLAGPDLPPAALQFASLPAMQVGGMQDEAAVLKSLGTKHPLLGPPLTLRNQLQQPAFLREVAGQSGLRFPPDQHPAPTRWLQKRFGMSGGLGVSWAKGPNLATSADNDNRPCSPFYFQQWIAGRAYGATFLSDGQSCCLIGICRSAFTRCGGKPFVYAGSAGPAPLPHRVVDKLQRLGRSLSRQGLRGLFNADFIVDRSGQVWLLEVNPRWSGSSELVERSMRQQRRLESDESLIGLAVTALQSQSGWLAERCQRLQTPLSQRHRPIHVKRIVFSRQDLVMDLPSIACCIDNQTDESLNIDLCDVPAPQTNIRAGQPILSLLARIDMHQAQNPMQRLRRCINCVQEGGV